MTSSHAIQYLILTNLHFESENTNNLFNIHYSKEKNSYFLWINLKSKNLIEITNPHSKLIDEFIESIEDKSKISKNEIDELCEYIDFLSNFYPYNISNITLNDSIFLSNIKDIELKNYLTFLKTNFNIDYIRFVKGKVNRG